ncbi:MAG: 2Fe-2S iron-sulfur cluster-binding protein, partial [Betaproteobacteria bacterium]
MNDPRPPAESIAFTVNGAPVAVRAAPATRLADLLRDELGLTGTKIGCNAGDCGSCTVLLDGRQVCACLTSVAQAGGRAVTTIEGLGRDGRLAPIQAAFHRHLGAQCGICTPGMILAAADLLARHPNPTEAQVQDGLGGVLCRCTGYRKIVEAVMDAAAHAPLPAAPPAGSALGARALKADGVAKVTGADRFGADGIPADALWLRVVRSPHARATFTLGDLDAMRRAHPGIEAILTAAHVPANGYGIYPDVKDQPVLAAGEVRYRGEAVLALVGSRAAVEALRDDALPIHWSVQSPVVGIDAAMAPGAALVQAAKPGHFLVEGQVRSGDTAAALRDC